VAPSPQRRGNNRSSNDLSSSDARKPQCRKRERQRVHSQLEVDEHVERIIAYCIGDFGDAPARSDQVTELIDVRRDLASNRVDAWMQVIREDLEARSIEACNPTPEIHADRADLEERRREADANPLAATRAARERPP
jgi:hypothetical protein